jgi:hypothetical protein
MSGFKMHLKNIHAIPPFVLIKSPKNNIRLLKSQNNIRYMIILYRKILLPLLGPPFLTITLRTLEA